MQVLASGDLVVRCLEPGDAGVYTCTTYNTAKPHLFDRVHTWLTMMPQGAPAVPQVCSLSALRLRTRRGDTPRYVIQFVTLR